MQLSSAELTDCGGNGRVCALIRFTIHIRSMQVAWGNFFKGRTASKNRILPNPVLVDYH